MDTTNDFLFQRGWGVTLDVSVCGWLCVCVALSHSCDCHQLMSVLEGGIHSFMLHSYHSFPLTTVCLGLLLTPMSLSLSCTISLALSLSLYVSLSGTCVHCNLCHPYINSRSLRSTGQGLLAVPCSRLKTKGARAFDVVAPALWNALPLASRSCATVYK